MSDPLIYNEWAQFINNYEYYFLSNEKAWQKKLDSVIEYIRTNQKRPSSSDRKTNIKALSVWICTQQSNYKTKSCIMKNKEIYDKWTQFINTQKYVKISDNKINEIEV